jgi:hypothetical protein
MAWNVLNPVGKKQRQGIEVDWRQRYKDLLKSIDYKDMERLRRENKRLSSRVKELSGLLNIHRELNSTVSLDDVDVNLAKLHGVKLSQLYEKYGKGTTRTKHILRFIAYHGYNMSLASVGWRYGKTCHSNMSRAMDRVVAWYQTGALTDAEIGFIRLYTNENIFDAYKK